MKILISRQEPRFKYFEAMKEALSGFDIRFDASPMLKDGSDGRLPAADSNHFSDLMPGFKKLHSIGELENLISGLEIRHAVFFDPMYPNSKVDLMVELLRFQGCKVHFLLNRHTVDRIRFGNLLRVVAHKPLSNIRRESLVVDTILAPTQLSLAGWAGRLKANRFIATQHIWSSPLSVKGGLADEVIFADSYIPFHTETVMHGPAPDPAEFYGRLMEFIRLVSEDARVDHVGFSLHPNSQGKEKIYIEKPARIIGSLATAKEFSSAKTIWSFGSSSSTFALAAGKSTHFLTFPDLMPKSLHSVIVHTGRSLGIPVYQFDGRVVRPVFGRSPLALLRRRIAELVFSALYSREALSVQEALELCLKPPGDELSPGRRPR